MFLSASVILDRDFLGRRYAQIKQRYPVSMTNYWPYLRQRLDEVAERKCVFQRSFLPRLFGNRVPISQDLWCSPDNEKQLVIATRYVNCSTKLVSTNACHRFVMTRAWFSISVGSTLQQTGTDAVVTDAQEIIKDEIWSVSTRSLITLESRTFYVLEQTCEVIGRATASPRFGVGIQAQRELQTASFVPRVDWSDYVQTRLLPQGFHEVAPSPLLSLLRSPNVEDYDKGVSKLWLRRIYTEGMVGEYKRIIAERYVMASVVANRCVFVPFICVIPTG